MSGIRLIPEKILLSRKSFGLLEFTLTRNPYCNRRTFFDFTDIRNRNKKYARRELVGYSMEQMFNVVADVQNYKSFVPFCNKSLILQKKQDFLKADMIVGFPPITERYTSNVTMKKPYIVKAECTDGRLFNYLLTIWRFSPGLQSNPLTCVVDFQVSFEFKSSLHSQLANLFFDKVVLQMEGAFFKEARQRYGQPVIQSHLLKVGETIV